MVRHGWRYSINRNDLERKQKPSVLFTSKRPCQRDHQKRRCERARLRALRVLASLERSLRKLRFLRHIAPAPKPKLLRLAASSLQVKQCCELDSYRVTRQFGETRRTLTRQAN